jgi:putative Holliday junction resolvase
MKIDSTRAETILAFDVGEKRIGVARAHLQALFPAPLMTLEDPARFIADIVALVSTEKAGFVVLGLPRGLGSQETDQTRRVQDFGRHLEAALTVPVYWNDEAVTSEKAEAELRKRGKSYTKADIDALAAVYILEDFIQSHPEIKNG